LPSGAPDYWGTIVTPEVIASYLSDLADVSVPSPTDGYVFYWDAAAAKWKCKAFVAAAHKTSHQDGGSDEISVVGLSGLLADDQHILDVEAQALINTHAAIAAAHHTKTIDASELTTGELPTARLSTNIKTLTITFIIDGGGAAITTGQKGHLEIPFACTLTGWTLVADVAGAIVIDVWKDTYANFPPTDADAMPGGGKEPTIAATNQKAQDTDIADWAAVAISAGDIMAFNVDSCTTITRVTLSLKATKS
jgi:hypothetical protein